MTDSIYKCDNHKLDLVCRGCVMARLEQLGALLKFVKSLAKISCCNVCECIACDSLKLLREIGEDK